MSRENVCQGTQCLHTALERRSSLTPYTGSILNTQAKSDRHFPPSSERKLQQMVQLQAISP